MSDKQKKSPLATWCTLVCVLMAVYVLMLGPVDGLQSAGRLPEPVATGLRWLYAPLAWIIAQAPEFIHQIFFRYVRFWVELLKP